MNFEWDREKARLNEARHDVTFEEAQTIFDDPLMALLPDMFHSIGEERFLAVGESIRQQLLVVSFTERGDNIRIISAREATRRERKDYEEGE